MIPVEIVTIARNLCMLRKRDLPKPIKDAIRYQRDALRKIGTRVVNGSVMGQFNSDDYYKAYRPYEHYEDEESGPIITFLENGGGDEEE
jgi:hypothetical protein